MWKQLVKTVHLPKCLTYKMSSLGVFVWMRRQLGTWRNVWLEKQSLLPKNFWERLYTVQRKDKSSVRTERQVFFWQLWLSLQFCCLGENILTWVFSLFGNTFHPNQISLGLDFCFQYPSQNPLSDQILEDIFLGPIDGELSEIKRNKIVLQKFCIT